MARADGATALLGMVGWVWLTPRITPIAWDTRLRPAQSPARDPPEGALRLYFSADAAGEQSGRSAGHQRGP